MISYGLNENHDMFSRDGRISSVSGVDSVVQRIKTRLLIFLNEWVLDTQAGTPWFEDIFVKPANLAKIEVIIKNRILQTEGVKELLSFDMVYENVTRGFSIEFECNTDFGESGAQVVEINV